MFRDKVEELLRAALTKREDLFLLNLSVGNDNSIKIVLDGDNGVNLNDCMEISRAIEHNLDREENDFFFGSDIRGSDLAFGASETVREERGGEIWRCEPKQLK